MPYKDSDVAKLKRTEYRAAHRDLFREQQRNYYEQHKEERKQYHREYQNKPEVKAHNRRVSVKRAYNLLPEQHVALLERQNYRCAFPHCGVVVDIFSPIDHNHGCCPITAKSCGKCVRSVLCKNHNIGLGMFEKLNPECLIDAYNYLVRTK